MTKTNETNNSLSKGQIESEFEDDFVSSQNEEHIRNRTGKDLVS